MSIQSSTNLAYRGYDIHINKKKTDLDQFLQEQKYNSLNVTSNDQNEYEYHLHTSKYERKKINYTNIVYKNMPKMYEKNKGIVLTFCLWQWLWGHHNYLYLFQGPQNHLEPPSHTDDLLQNKKNMAQNESIMTIGHITIKITTTSTIYKLYCHTHQPTHIHPYPQLPPYQPYSDTPFNPQIYFPPLLSAHTHSLVA